MRAELSNGDRLASTAGTTGDIYEQLDLTPHQRRQASSKVSETSQQVDSLTAETFTMMLTPEQQPGTLTIAWDTTQGRTTATWFEAPFGEGTCSALQR